MSKIWNKATGFRADSKWEEALTKGVMKDFDYHPEIVKYIVPASDHKYKPDWILKKIDNEEVFGTEVTYILIEAKGRFRSREEMNKYIHIKNSLHFTSELVFLFQKPQVHVFGAAKRKDGTRMSHAEWADKHGFRHFTEATIKELLK